MSEEDGSRRHSLSIKSANLSRPVLQVGSGSTTLMDVTNRARTNGKKLFFGEFGTPTDSTSLTELAAQLAHIDSNRDVWIGWSRWGGGPAWGGNYPLVLDPNPLIGGSDQGQMATLVAHEN